MQVILEAPSRRREEDYLSAVRRSQSLHRQLVTPPSTPQKYRQYLKATLSDRHANFFVVEKSSRELVGVINIENIVRGFFKSACLGYFAFMPHAGRGLMREGITLVIAHAFNDLKLHRLEANIQPANLRSKGIVKSLGFEQEGFSKRYLKIGGRWRDHERWALLAEEWTGRSKSV
jgi:ribosomal-protein-alanine N-acetyltransferase